MNIVNYTNLDVKSILSRLRTKRPDIRITTSGVQNPSNANLVTDLILHFAVGIRAYQTSHTDPVDAVVVLLRDLVPNMPAAELQREYYDGDGQSLCALGMYNFLGMKGVKQDADAGYEMVKRAGKQCQLLHPLAVMVELTRLRSFRDKPNYDFMHHIFDVSNDGPFAFSCYEELETLCSSDYVCPVSVMMAAYVHYNVPDKYSTPIREFVERHPDALEYYVKAASIPCGNRQCEYGGYCLLGQVIAIRCKKCQHPYCCYKCYVLGRAHHEASGCNPDRTPAWWSLQKETEYVNFYLDHVLHMFGIVLPHGELLAPLLMEDEMEAEYYNMNNEPIESAAAVTRRNRRKKERRRHKQLVDDDDGAVNQTVSPSVTTDCKSMSDDTASIDTLDIHALLSDNCRVDGDSENNVAAQTSQATAQQASVQESQASVQQASVQQASVQQASVQQASAQQTSAQQTSVQQASGLPITRRKKQTNQIKIKTNSEDKAELADGVIKDAVVSMPSTTAATTVTSMTSSSVSSPSIVEPVQHTVQPTVQHTPSALDHRIIPSTRMIECCPVCIRKHDELEDQHAVVFKCNHMLCQMSVSHGDQITRQIRCDHIIVMPHVSCRVA